MIRPHLPCLAVILDNLLVPTYLYRPPLTDAKWRAREGDQGSGCMWLGRSRSLAEDLGAG